MTPSASPLHSQSSDWIQTARQQCLDFRSWSREAERNTIAAIFHMITITLICTALANEDWFRLQARGTNCAPMVGTPQFFKYIKPVSEQFPKPQQNPNRGAEVKASIRSDIYSKPVAHPFNISEPKAVHL